jgi:hypothetical protein
MICIFRTVSVKLEESPSKKSVDTSDLPSSGKRPRDASDSETDKPEVKKPCLEESTPLEGDLSDISDDDADEILNREDSVSSGRFVGYEVLTAVDITPCSPAKVNRHLRGTYRLHLQG